MRLYLTVHIRIRREPVFCTIKMAFIFPNKNIKYKSDTVAVHMPEITTSRQTSKMLKCLFEGSVTAFPL